MMELPSFTGFFESSRSPKGMLLKWSSSITLAWFTEFYRVFFLVSANVYLVFFYNNNNNRNEMGTESILVLFLFYFIFFYIFCLFLVSFVAVAAKVRRHVVGGLRDDPNVSILIGRRLFFFFFFFFFFRTAPSLFVLFVCLFVFFSINSSFRVMAKREKKCLIFEAKKRKRKRKEKEQASDWCADLRFRPRKDAIGAESTDQWRTTRRRLIGPVTSAITNEEPDGRR